MLFQMKGVVLTMCMCNAWCGQAAAWESERAALVEGLTACDAAYDAVLIELRDAKIEAEGLRAELATAADRETLVATLKQNMKDVRGQLEATRVQMAQAEEAAKATIARLEADLAAAVREAREAEAEFERLQETMAAVSSEVQVGAVSSRVNDA